MILSWTWIKLIISKKKNQPWLLKQIQYWRGKKSNARETLESRRTEPEKNAVRGRGDSSPSFSANLKPSKYLLFCPIFIHNMEIQEATGEKVRNERNKKCNSFPRIMVAKFQIRTSHSRTGIENGRQIGDRKWHVQMVCVQVRWAKPGHYSQQHNQVWSWNESNLLMSSWILIPENLFGLMLEREAGMCALLP